LKVVGIMMLIVVCISSVPYNLELNLLPISNFGGYATIRANALSTCREFQSHVALLELHHVSQLPQELTVSPLLWIPFASSLG